jgi:hypothetical protein
MKKNYSTERMNKICFYRNGHIESAGNHLVTNPLSLSKSNPLLKNIAFNSKYWNFTGQLPIFFEGGE